MHAPAIEIGIATSGTNTVRTDPINRKTTIATIAIVSASVMPISFSALRM